MNYRVFHKTVLLNFTWTQLSSSWIIRFLHLHSHFIFSLSRRLHSLDHLPLLSHCYFHSTPVSVSNFQKIFDFISISFHIQKTTRRWKYTKKHWTTMDKFLNLLSTLLSFLLRIHFQSLRANFLFLSFGRKRKVCVETEETLHFGPKVLFLEFCIRYQDLWPCTQIKRRINYKSLSPLSAHCLLDNVLVLLINTFFVSIWSRSLASFLFLCPKLSPVYGLRVHACIVWSAFCSKFILVQCTCVKAALQVHFPNDRTKTVKLTIARCFFTTRVLSRLLCVCSFDCCHNFNGDNVEGRKQKPITPSNTRLGLQQRL